MKTTLTTALLAIAFLGAGAFANGGSHKSATPVRHAQVNHTSIAKNQAWPIREMMTTEPCAASRCIAI
jgi:hypothetical protein